MSAPASEQSATLQELAKWAVGAEAIDLVMIVDIVRLLPKLRTSTDVVELKHIHNGANRWQLNSILRKPANR